jgi:hypothetical protein
LSLPPLLSYRLRTASIADTDGYGCNHHGQLLLDVCKMKRILIFTALFPPLALLIFCAPDVITRHDFKMLDFTSLQMAYIIAVIPALLSAAVDGALHRVLGTTIAGAAIAYLDHDESGRGIRQRIYDV